MSEYIYSILVISVISGILKAIISSFNPGIKKQINYLVGLICALAILSPLASLVADITSTQEKINSFFDTVIAEEKINSSNQIIINSGVEKISEGIKASLVTKFKFDESEIFVKVKIDDKDINSLKISYIDVTLTGKASWSDTEKVKEYLEDLVGCEFIVKRR